MCLKMALVPLSPWPALLGFGEPQSVNICQGSNDRGPLERMAGFLEPPVRCRNGAGELARRTLCQGGTSIPGVVAPWREKQMGRTCVDHESSAATRRRALEHPSAPLQLWPVLESLWPQAPHAFAIRSKGNDNWKKRMSRETGVKS